MTNAVHIHNEWRGQLLVRSIYFNAFCLLFHSMNEQSRSSTVAEPINGLHGFNSTVIIFIIPNQMKYFYVRKKRCHQILCRENQLKSS